MDSIPPQQYPAEQPAPVKTWPARLTGVGIVFVCLLLLACLLSYDFNEMGWGFLNTRNAEAASAVPCTNVLGTFGLYIAGLLYYLLGAAAPYAVVLCSIVGCGMILDPGVKRAIQWISFGIMLVSACAFLDVQNFGGAEWAEGICLKGVGGFVGYLFGSCIVAALLGATYAAIIFLIVHCVTLIYFALLTPGQVSRGVGNDIQSLWQLWLKRKERKRLEREARAQEWKNTVNNPQPADAVSNAPTGGEPQQLPLPITTNDGVQQQPASVPAPVRQRPPLVIPPRPADHPDPLQPRQLQQTQPEPPQQHTPAPQAPLPPRQRPPLVIPPRPADHPDPLQPRQQLHTQPEPEPEPLPQPEPEPVAPVRPAAPVRKESGKNRQLPHGHGDNLLDLMEGIEDDIEESSFTGRSVTPAAVPHREVHLNPRLQAAANRHMGIQEPAPRPEPPVREQPVIRKEPVSRPAAVPVQAPAPAPVDDYNGMYVDYPLPPYDLLNYTPPSPEVARAAEEESYEVQQCLIDTFSNFNIAVEPGDITRGPSLTRYEFYPPKGLRLSRIANLGNDLMLATQTKSVNILAPIPGKNTVGVELENATKESVYLRELLESPAFHNPKLKIPVALGKNVYGEPVIGDLAAMPHALVAGTTGSGKSVCINSMILSMLYKFRPDELRLVLVDPKVVEMQPYRKLPHLACPVVTNPARVIGALRWAVNEMEHRYSMFSKIGVRNFEDFNNRPEGYMPEPEEEEPQDELPINNDIINSIMSDIERSAGEDIPEEDETQGELDFDADGQIPAKLPYIVIIIDELADLMMVVKEDLENYIARLTQKARAAGIHLVAATQTPRSNVVTGLIKANIPCRIALKVASPLDSRIILDTNGAENLLGKGDLIFLPPGGITKLTRAQGAWVSDAEIASIIKFCASHAKQKFDQNVTAEMNNADGSGPGGPGSDGENGRLSGSGGGNEDDELYTRCVNLVVTERKASTSLLQRRFSIGYGRAAKIMDMMEARGVISSPQGATRAREVLVEAPE